MDIPTITSALAGIQTATSLAKGLWEADISLEKADQKFKLAEIIEALADAKISIADFKELLIEKEKEISDLKEKLERKDKVKFDGNHYWIEGDSVPFCSVCYERDSKLHHLKYIPENRLSSPSYLCKICGNGFRIK